MNWSTVPAASEESASVQGRELEVEMLSDLSCAHRGEQSNDVGPKGLPEMSCLGSEASFFEHPVTQARQLRQTFGQHRTLRLKGQKDFSWHECCFLCS